MLGLDLRGRRIRAVAMCQARCRYSLPGRMRRPGDGWRFGAAVDIPSSENADNMAQLLRDRVRPLLGELPWHQRRVALCVPTSFMLMHTEKVPRSFTDEDLQALVRADCGQWLGVERDELLLDYLLTDNQADRAPARSLPSEPETATLHIYACPGNSCNNGWSSAPRRDCSLLCWTWRAWPCCDSFDSLASTIRKVCFWKLMLTEYPYICLQSRC